eukprot:TRINITY_DN5279_c1_g1_i1.p1 TRINITY_DN5279_c1_g1~~TRINITY_DN5279_c1_g1_i1.p1  ORF type:complete len:140 (+),score=48.76 TRINITY_DN5279_c1_g1_i1:104-523(+)
MQRENGVIVDWLTSDFIDLLYQNYLLVWFIFFSTLFIYYLYKIGTLKTFFSKFLPKKKDFDQKTLEDLEEGKRVARLLQQEKVRNASTQLKIKQQLKKTQPPSKSDSSNNTNYKPEWNPLFGQSSGQSYRSSRPTKKGG